jgi:hypothetical protein
MLVPPNDFIYQNPKTPAQLRAVLDAIKRRGNDFSSTITDHEVRITVIEGFVGNEEAIYDSTAVVGQPLYISDDDHVDLADASTLTTANVIGVCLEDTTVGNTGNYLTHGVVERADWTPVIGTTNLTPNGKYYLSETTGMLTTTAPTAVGAVVQFVGTAISITRLSVHQHSSVLL